MRGMGATECRQAPDDLSAVPEGLLGGFELHVYLGDRAGASKELDAGEGHLEQIVQMMGGAGGELPSGLEGPGTDQVGLGAREVLIGPLYVLIEPGVLKDERRVIGEGLGEGNLVIAKETPLAIPDGEGPDHTVLDPKGDSEDRPIRALRNPRSESRGEGHARVHQQVWGRDRLALGDGDAGDAGAPGEDNVLAQDGGDIR